MFFLVPVPQFPVVSVPGFSAVHLYDPQYFFLPPEVCFPLPERKHGHKFPSQWPVNKSFPQDVTFSHLQTASRGQPSLKLPAMSITISNNSCKTGG